MSPEQANGEAVDHRSDLFSLGSVMYAMCTGRPPFRAETTLAVLRRVGDTVPRPIREINGDVPDWLEHIVAKLIAKDVANRFAKAAEVAMLLEQCLAHVQQPTSVALPEACRSVSRGKFDRKVFWGVAAVLLALVVIGAVLNRQNVKPSSTMPKDESVKTATESPGFDSLLQWNSTQEGLDSTENEINLASTDAGLDGGYKSSKIVKGE